MKRNLLFVLVALLPVVAFSDEEYSIHGCDAIIDGICYKFPSSSGDEAWVSYEWYHYSMLSTNTSRFEWIETEPKYSGDIVIPETISYNGKTYRVTGINEYAFYKCGNLSSVTLPGSLRSIGSYAFSDCTGLVSVSIPKGMKRISDHIFYKCSGLKTITIPESVTDILEEAFSYCTGLTDVYCFAECAPKATNAFDYVDLSNIMLHVPMGYEESYRNTLPWKNFGMTVTGIEINSTNFPDGWFRQWILEQPMGFDGVLTDEEVANVKELHLYYDYDYPPFDTGCGPISSLKGIEFFTELTNLSCGGLSLTVLDLTKNTNLTVLHCEGQYLTELDLTKNAKLKELWFEANHRDVMVDISNCSALKVADFTDSKLIGLNVSGCSALEILQCERGKLTALNVSGCSSLTMLECEANNLNVINVSGCTALTRLWFGNNKIKGAGMDALVESLPITSTGFLYVLWKDNNVHDQNVMTTTQVAAAKAKGWRVLCYDNGNTVDYAGSEAIESVTFTKDQMATIILPTAPDASKGKYYRLDRCEEGHIIFEQELQPQARTPYIIVPNEDFSIDLGTLHLEGLSNDTVSIKGINFIGSYVGEVLDNKEGWYVDIIDTTPDCLKAELSTEKSVVGALRAYLMVNWDDPYNHPGSKGPDDKLEIVLKDDPDDLNSLTPTLSQGEGVIYDLQGRRLSGKPTRGIFIEDGQIKVR